jgi:16S rRNA (guanine966-N2)-methyltransferase
VTRIIGGEARGRRIRAPSGEETRPTSDRVREALFSSLESELGTLRGRTFLDLYAGSGGVGLEARSRGAVVTLVERSPRAGVPGGFEVVFADPPYGYAATRLTDDLQAIAARGWLTPRALVVIERDRRTPWLWPEGFLSVRDRGYGETMLWYGLWAPTAAEEV